MTSNGDIVPPPPTSVSARLTYDGARSTAHAGLVKIFNYYAGVDKSLAGTKGGGLSTINMSEMATLAEDSGL